MPSDLTGKIRSWLFAPGDSARKMAKAADGPADRVILDLEDAVADAEKPRARTMVHEFLASRGGGDPRLWVRVNPLDGPHTLADLAAVMPAQPGGIMVPKVRGRADVERVDHFLSALEAAHGIALGATQVLPLVTETAAAMFTTGDYAGVPRLIGLTWGAEDLADSLGAFSNLQPGGSYRFTFELARSLTLIGAAAAGVAAIETIHGDFRDSEGLQVRAEMVRSDGFAGMLAIHPDQVPIINAAFTPSAAQVAEAQAILALFAANPGAGALSFDGKMLDRPHLARAHHVLAQAEASGGQG